MSEARMHLDGCHFFAWVFENPQGDDEVTLYERTGSDLDMHADRDSCDRCLALLRGAPTHEPRSTTVVLPEDAKGALLAVFHAIGSIGVES